MGAGSSAAQKLAVGAASSPGLSTIAARPSVLRLVGSLGPINVAGSVSAAIIGAIRGIDGGVAIAIADTAAGGGSEEAERSAEVLRIGRGGRVVLICQSLGSTCIACIAGCRRWVPWGCCGALM